MRLALLAFILALPCARTSAQDASPSSPATEPAPRPSRAPRLYALTLGYAFTPKNDLPLATDDGTHRPMGLAVEARYGWQVGGLDGSRPSWVGFQTSFFAHTRGAPRTSLGFDYGIFARHALLARASVRPFLAYGLGASQVFVRGVSGRGISHLTALSAGVDVATGGAVHVTIELAYRFVILPSFATEIEPAHRYDFHALRLVAGVVFGR